jgi:hypothetical protein
LTEADLAKSGARADPTQERWSAVESMLATVIDEMRISRWTYVQAHSDKTIPKPTPIPRPGVPSRTGRLMKLSDAQRIDPRLRGLGEAEAQAMLDRLTGKGGQ